MKIGKISTLILIASVISLSTIYKASANNLISNKVNLESQNKLRFANQKDDIFKGGGSSEYNIIQACSLVSGYGWNNPTQEDLIWEKSIRRVVKKTKKNFDDDYEYVGEYYFREIEMGNRNFIIYFLLIGETWFLDYDYNLTELTVENNTVRLLVEDIDDYSDTFIQFAKVSSPIYVGDVYENKNSGRKYYK